MNTAKESIDRKLQGLKTTNADAHVAHAKAEIDAEVAQFKSSVDELGATFKTSATK